MRLYHFTNGHNLKLICGEKNIKLGKIRSNVLDLIDAVSLTDEFDAIGHGLTNGKVITKKQATALGYFTEVNGQFMSIDCTKYCIAIDIDDTDPKLSRAVDYYKGTNILAALEIAGYFPNDIDLMDSQIAYANKNFANNLWRRKGKTWWYYLDNIQLSPLRNPTVCFNHNGAWHQCSVEEVISNL